MALLSRSAILLLERLDDLVAGQRAAGASSWLRDPELTPDERAALAELEHERLIERKLAGPGLADSRSARIWGVGGDGELVRRQRPIYEEVRVTERGVVRLERLRAGRVRRTGTG